VNKLKGVSMNKASKYFRFLLVLLITLITTNLIAGGFYISVRLNNGDKTSYAKDVLLIVKPFGCHKPNDANIWGTAEGIINGTRKSFELKFQKTGNGEFTIVKQWSDEGVWVLAINAAYNNSERSAIVEVGTNYNLVSNGNSKDEPGIKLFDKKLSKPEIETALKKQNDLNKKV
jgi:hypothetical protein